MKNRVFQFEVTNHPSFLNKQRSWVEQAVAFGKKAHDGKTYIFHTHTHTPTHPIHAKQALTTTGSCGV